MNNFNFKSYDTSKQSISYCEVDKCPAVIKLKAENEELKEEINNKYSVSNFNVIFMREHIHNLKQALAKYKQVIEKVREVCGMALCGDDTRSLILEICDEVNDV